jgi:hypothetical protein
MGGVIKKSDGLAKLNKTRINAMVRRLGQKDKLVFGELKTVHSDEDRVRAVNAYLLHGKMPKVAELTGIPVHTLRDWKAKAAWWKNLEDLLRDEHNTAVAGELTDVVDITIRAIQDRIKNGDFLYNPRSGEITRVPVKMADLNKVAGTLIDKRQTLQKQPTKYNNNAPESGESTKNQLAQLAKAFADFTTKGRTAQLISNDREATANAVEGELVQCRT